MEKIENPASRLHSILVKVSDLCDESYSQNIDYKNVWSKVLEVEENDLSKMMQGLIGVQNLYEQTYNIIKNDEKLNTDKNKKYLKNIYNAIYTVNLEGNMKTYSDNITTETLLAFSYIKDLIEHLYNLPTIVLKENEKKDLINNIDSLIESFIESDLPKDLKSISASSLMNIKDAIVHYNIYGANRLHESIAKATGSLYLLGDSTIKNKDNENIQNLFTIIDRINSLFTTTESGIKIATVVNNFIT